MYEKLGIPLKERAILAGVEGAEEAEEQRPQIAVDAVFDSVSVATTFRESLAKAGVIFCPISEAVRDHPDLVRQYLGSVVPAERQFLRGAEFRGVHRWQLRVHPQGRALPDGAVHLFPHQCAQYRPVRAHADHRRGRQPRVSYLEGCTAPQRDENQLHAAVVELVAMDDAQHQIQHGAELVSRRR